MTDRRSFLRNTSLLTAAACVPRSVFGFSEDKGWRMRTPGAPFTANDVDLRALAHRALDAATSAGAQYADVRFTLTRAQQVSYLVTEYEQMAVGVRALVNGAWGFVGSAVWTADEVARLGKQAAQQASYNKWKSGPGIELAPLPKPATGTWSTPVKRDVFDVSIEEKMDFVEALSAYATRHSDVTALVGLEFQRQEQTFASTDGAFATQVLHRSLGGYSTISVSSGDFTRGTSARRDVDFFGATAGGYEVATDAKLYDVVDTLYADSLRMQTLAPVEIGKFDVVFDSYAMAALVGQTVGEAMELDRVRGYEANAGGTSYLAPALDMVGQRQLGPSMLNIRADRSSLHGAATVKWDTEGAEPTDFDLIRDGVVVDYATTREHAGALAPWYRTSGRPTGTRGCSSGENAMSVPLVGTPNLSMQPATSSVTFDDLVADLQNGYAVVGGSWNMDQQKLNGQGMGAMVSRVRNGRLGQCVGGAAFLIRSPEFWKSLQAIGGAASARQKGFTSKKGQPSQEYDYSVSAVPAKFSGVSVIDFHRKGSR